MAFQEGGIMLIAIAMTVIGYLSGSFLAAYYLPKWFLKIDVTKEGDDGNPGTANAFLCAGGICGTIVLVIELLKGFLPVQIASRLINPMTYRFIPILVAPVLGHTFSCFFGGKGGKGIAVSFGVLLGLIPEWRPVLFLAFYYILFSTLLRIASHKQRSILSYIVWFITVVYVIRNMAIAIGCFMIAAMVIYKHMSFGKYQKPLSAGAACIFRK